MLIIDLNTFDDLKQEHIDEIARCADPVTGLKHFIDTYVVIPSPTGGIQKFHPSHVQINTLANLSSHKHTINILPKSTGKTTCIAIYALWHALFIENSNIRILSPYRTVVQSTIAIAYTILNKLPPYFIPGSIRNQTKMLFSNGSGIRASVISPIPFLEYSHDVLIIELGNNKITSTTRAYLRKYVQKLPGNLHFLCEPALSITWNDISLIRLPNVNEFSIYHALRTYEQ
jgi:hypothetical protein